MQTQPEHPGNPLNRRIKIGDLDIGLDLPFVLIAGPCQIESRDHAMEMAAALSDICGEREIGLIYKSSFDKANRTSGGSARGVGLKKGASRSWRRCGTPSAAR